MTRPDTSSLQRILSAVRSRGRMNALLQAGADVVVGSLAVLVGWRLWNALMPLPWGVGGWLPMLAFVVLLARAASTLRKRETLSNAAASTDQQADLHDELVSAWWFSRHDPGSDWVDLHLDRAGQTASGLDARRLVPTRRPTHLGWIAGLAAALVLLQLVPVPRVFSDVVDRLAAVLPGGDQESKLIAELAEMEGEGAEELLEEPPPDEDLLLPAEDGEQQGEETLPEQEGQLQEQGEEPPEGEEQQPAEEQGEQSGDPAEQQEGESADAENPEDAEGEGEGEPEADPNASEQPGEGEQAEESDSMLPGGEEVFLQEGGEDVEQAEMSEEEMGHATREGGGEEELEDGELSTLEVQLQQEMLELPEDLPEPDAEDSEEEKEELITKAERSFMEFENMPATEQFAIQELLQTESIPWRYRQLVLNYFKMLRARDNANRDGEPEGRQR